MKCLGLPSRRGAIFWLIFASIGILSGLFTAIRHETTTKRGEDALSRDEGLEVVPRVPSPPVEPYSICQAPQNVTLDRLQWKTMSMGGGDGDGARVARTRLLVDGATLDISHEQALKALKGRRILFLGDSLTRYQYLNLIYFLATGKWHSPAPENEAERSHRTWASFFQTTVERVNFPHLGRGMLCDCYRPQPPANLNEVAENRYYRDAPNNISVDFLQVWGRIPAHGHSLDWLNVTCGYTAWPCKQSGCAVAECHRNASGGKFHWSFPAPEPALSSLAQMLNPDTIVYNAGLWVSYSFNDTALEQLLAGGQLARKAGVRHLFWKTTTASFADKDEKRLAELSWLYPQLQKNGDWLLYDTWTLSLAARRAVEEGQSAKEKLFVDGRHLAPDLYRGFNEVLLRQLVEADQKIGLEVECS